MKWVFWYVVKTAIIYTVVVGIAWTWALGLSFAWWKLPLIGVAQAVLNLIAVATPPAHPTKTEVAR